MPFGYHTRVVVVPVPVYVIIHAYRADQGATRQERYKLTPVLGLRADMLSYRRLVVPEMLCGAGGDAGLLRYSLRIRRMSQRRRGDGGDDVAMCRVILRSGLRMTCHLAQENGYVSPHATKQANGHDCSNPAYQEAQAPDDAYTYTVVEGTMYAGCATVSLLCHVCRGGAAHRSGRS